MESDTFKKILKLSLLAGGILFIAVLFSIFSPIPGTNRVFPLIKKTASMTDLTSVAAGTTTPTPPFQPSQTQPSEGALQPTFTHIPTETSPPKTIWIDPTLPETLKTQLHIPQGFSRSDRRDQASVLITLGDESIVGHWTYALVSPFPTLADGIQSSDLMSLWEGQKKDTISQSLTVSEETKRILSSWWGPPQEGSITILPQDLILDNLWPNPQHWALIPFEELNPRWKVLEVQGQKPIHKDYDPTHALLSIPISVSGFPTYRSEILAANPSFSNWVPEEMTTVLITGVTALVRDTAALMEENGITYPAQNIGGLLRSADYTHISNEVPFATDCPTPDPAQPDLYFCSDDRYLELLEYIGTDIVELSGDHFGDWGDQAMYHTLQLYDDQGWHTYGGGRTLEEGLQPILFEHNGNRFAFIGCNAKTGKKYATASDTKPGAARCDYPWMKERIRDLKEDGYITIVTLQHEEVYQYSAVYIQQRDFRSLAQAGGDIVSGSQAHQPQAIEFHENSLIHYGLGNLFFDQYYLSQHFQKYEHADEAFIDLHVFYENRHISTELITLQFVDNAQSRLMTDQERNNLLSSVFKSSDW